MVEEEVLLYVDVLVVCWAEVEDDVAIDEDTDEARAVVEEEVLEYVDVLDVCRAEVELDAVEVDAEDFRLVTFEVDSVLGDEVDEPDFCVDVLTGVVDATTVALEDLTEVEELYPTELTIEDPVLADVEVATETAVVFEVFVPTTSVELLHSP